VASCWIQLHIENLLAQDAFMALALPRAHRALLQMP